MKESVTLILAAFGTSFPAARERAYAPVEEAVQRALPDVTIFWAYTSRIVRAKMKREQGVTVPDVCEAVVAAQSSSVAVQPILVLPGSEYDTKVVECARDVPVGTTLLHDAADVEAFARLLAEESRPADGEYVVFVGHGTHHEADRRYAELQAEFDRRGDSCLLGTIEGDLPIELVVQRLRDRGVQRVRVRPLMLTAGDHVQNDIAGEDESWLTDLREAGFHAEFENVTLLDLDAVRRMITSRCVALVEALHDEQEP